MSELMKVYELTVYRDGRRAEQVFHKRVFTSRNSQSELYAKFVKDYDGFNIRLVQVENIETVVVPVAVPAMAQKSVDSLTIRVSMTAEERGMYVDVLKSSEELDKKKGNFERAVSNRFHAAISELGSVYAVETAYDHCYSVLLKVRLSGGVQAIVELLEKKMGAE